MIDRWTKLLLLAIALGLWVNVATTMLQPHGVSAQDRIDLSNVESRLSSIRSDLSSIQSDASSIRSEIGNIERDVDDIEDGTCTNKKICN